MHLIILILILFLVVVFFSARACTPCASRCTGMEFVGAPRCVSERRTVKSLGSIFIYRIVDRLQLIDGRNPEPLLIAINIVLCKQTSTITSKRSTVCTFAFHVCTQTCAACADFIL